MPLLNRGAIANFFGLADEEEYEEYPETSKPAVAQPTTKKKPIQPTQSQMSQPRAVSKPRAQQTTRPVARESVAASEATLVNFHLVEEKQARRIVDFLTGTVYALDGDIKRVGDEIFLCTPTGMEIDSSTAQSFADVNLFDL